MSKIIKVTDVHIKDCWYSSRHKLMDKIFVFIHKESTWTGWEEGYLSIVGPLIPLTEYPEDIDDVYVLGIKYTELDKNEYPEYYL